MCLGQLPSILRVPLVRNKFLPLLMALAAAMMVTTAFAEPLVPGLHGKHPLSQRQVGEVLVNELRCAACHRRENAGEPLEKAAPDLAAVGGRLSPEFLQQFIASPSTARAGTTMPDLLLAQSPEDREQIAEAITHFLVAQSTQAFKRDAVKKEEAAAGQELFHSVGCIACHSARDDRGREVTGAGVVPLQHVPAKYSLASLGEFLFQPLRVRPTGRMPDMKLTPAEAQAIASYLLGSQVVATAPFQPQEQLVKRGKQYFQQFNCSACHQLEGVPAATPGPAFVDVDPTRGCLAVKPDKAPHYGLSDTQTVAIRTALANKGADRSDQDQVAITMTTFNCIACHVRDDFGGVSAERNLLFQTSEKNLGDDARIPPPLTLVGAKLQTVWMKKVLFDAESVRPYMFTRMPQYGEANLGHLPELLARLDVLEEVELVIPNPEKERDRAREKVLRTAGRELLGDKGLYCIACHNFNGKPSPVHKGLDLMTSYQRLKPSWFSHFVRSPATYRPGIVMPVSWPEGEAVQKTILDGDTDAQIEAIWYYLSLGTSAADPAGIRGVESRIQVTDTPRTYRGRSSIAGTRGIAVGFPAGLHYAFNAETGSLTGLWRGDFLRVDRSGQGAGTFHPIGRAISLAQDVSFFDLQDEAAAWPLRPVMTKEKPVNPDPLYPKNVGYQFDGYYFDDAWVPTLMYRTGEIAIEDRSAVDKVGDKPVLARVLKLSAPKAQTIWFRALTGKVTAETKQQFQTADLRLSIPPVQTLLRPLATDDGAAELLLKFDLPAGKSTVSLIYETLP